MSSNMPIHGKLKTKKPRKKIWLAVIVCLVIAAVSAAGVHFLKAKNANGEVKQQTAQVRRGDLSVTVTGSGPISSTNEYDVTSNVNGTLTKIYFKDGDTVKAGDLIFEIDDKDARLDIRQIKNSIAQAELSQEYNLRDLQYNAVAALIGGEVVDVQVKEGDNISSGSTLMTITDKSKLKLLVAFGNSYRNKLNKGQEVTVNAFDTTTEELYIVKGQISNVSSPSYETGDGAEVYNVEITIDNPGSLEEDMVANAEVDIDGNAVKSKDSGTLSYANSVTVKSETSGKISAVNAEDGRNVKKGDVLATLQNEDLQLDIATSELKLEDLKIQLETAEEKLLDYKIYTTIGGTFTLNDVEQGNSIQQGDILGTVANYDTMAFDIDIDELDIAKIKVGQTADITLDALTETEDTPLKGTVTKIAIEGTSSDGVSTYPVTIEIEENDALKGGMNADAEIVVNEKTNVLYVPVEAIQEKNGKSYVMVVKDAAVGDKNGDKESGSNIKSGENASGATMTEVTTGISTDSYTEIVSGLNEGDTVVVMSAASSSSTQQQQPSGMMPMNGGGGPPPGGGGGGGPRN